MKKPFKFGHLQAIVLLFIAAVATWRVLSVHDGDDVSAMANFTPIGAMALFGGAYFSRINSFIFPLLTLWLSDIMLNRFVFYGEWVFFYNGFLWVYGAFALMVLAGRWMQPNKGVGRFSRFINSDRIYTLDCDRHRGMALRHSLSHDAGRILAMPCGSHPV